MTWEKTNNRFVSFFDILGFKDMVLKTSHNDILIKLENLKKHVTKLEEMQWDDEREKKSKIKINPNQTKSITFSDSFIFFSRGDTIEDFFKIILDSWNIYIKAIENGIAIKGAISFGEVTVDFDKNLFFGQPIIDAFLLHEDLYMLNIILDHNVENQINLFEKNDIIERSLSFQKVRLKFGTATHTLLSMNTIKGADEQIGRLKKLYKITSGKPRQYIDNTIDFYESLKVILSSSKDNESVKK